MKTTLAIAAVIALAATSGWAPAEAYDGALLGGPATGSVIGDIAAGAHGSHGYGDRSPGYTSYGFGPGFHHPAYTHSYATYGAAPYHRRWNRYHW